MPSWGAEVESDGPYRRFLMVHYMRQYLRASHNHMDQNVPDEVKEKLATETEELLETAWRSHEKEITKRDEFRLI